MSKDEIFEKENLEELFKNNFINSRTKGIDKVNAVGFLNRKEEFLDIIDRKLKSNNYTFSPYIEVLKLKGRHQFPRIISIPTLRDRLVLLAIKEYLHESFPESVNKKLPNSYIRDIKKYLSKNKKDKFFFKVDITKYYDSINRELLLEKLKSRGLDNPVLSLIKNAIETPTVPQNTRSVNYLKFKTTTGVPQGLSISNILAQIYMEDVDSKLNKRQYFYTRYVDDILILNDSPISKFRQKNLKEAIVKIDLEFNEKKTEIGKVKDGFKFLSYHIEGEKISIAEKNVQLFIRRIAGKFTWLKNGLSNKYERPQWLRDDEERFKEVFLEELNEMITGVISSNKKYGWLFYFAEMNDKALLFKLDKIVAGFFENIKAFENKAPIALKRLVRSYHVIRFDTNKNYIANFDEHDTIKKKWDYLVFRGELSSKITYSDEEIERAFENFRNKILTRLEKDLGYNYN